MQSSSYINQSLTVSSEQDLRTRGQWYNPGLGQYSFQGLMKVIATGFIPLSLVSIIVLTQVMWENSQWVGENILLKELQESMDTCTGFCIITEILLKMALNTIQSINHTINMH